MKRGRFVFVVKEFLKDPRGSRVMVGPLVQTYLLSKELIHRGWDVSYIALSGNRVRYEKRKVDGIKVHFIAMRKLSYMAPLSPLWVRKEIEKRLNEIGPDVIYSRGRSVLAWLVSRYSRKNGALSIWNAARDRDFNRFEYAKMKSSYGAFLRRVAKYIAFSISHVFLFERGIRATDICICQNEFQKEMFLQSYPAREVQLLGSIVDIPNGVAKKCQTPRVLWVAGVKGEKQPDVIIRLAERCRDRNIQFDCVGDPLDKELVVSLMDYARANGNFHYHGHVDYFEIGNFFQKAHLFINTSIEEAEGFPNTFLQAWASQTPVISLNADPNRLLSERKLGVLAGSLENLYQSTCEILKDREKRREIGTRAREYVIHHHSPGLIIDQLEGYIASARRERTAILEVCSAAQRRVI